MAYNDNIIKALRRCFEAVDKNSQYYNSKFPFTNCALVFAYNGTGKTRLSYDFAHYGRNEETPQHTLYYNAYTEDLFTWDNDLENNTDHRLLINKNSSLIQGLAGTEFTVELRKYLQVFADIDFDFDYVDENPALPPCAVRFNKNVKHTQILNGEKVEFDDKVENIKISRGEERLFVWCFFRCILDQVIGGNDAYKNIEYIYIDDPMSSLDDNNVIAFAEQLYSVIRQQRNQEVKENETKDDIRRIKFVVSSHHSLFFHTMLHGLNGDQKLGKYYLSRNKQKDQLVLKSMDDSMPFYYNVAMMSEIKKAIDSGKLYTFHFTVLRSIMEKIKEFFGHRDFAIILEGITYKGETYDKTAFSQEELTEFYSRVMNVLTHQGSMFTPILMNDDNKELATAIFNHLVKKYQFVLPNLNDFRSEAWIASHSDE